MVYAEVTDQKGSEHMLNRLRRQANRPTGGALNPEPRDRTMPGVRKSGL